MKSSKIEKLSIILTVLGIFAIIIVSQLKRFFDLGFIPIIVYVVGGLLILGGLICYFKNYYKSKNYETKDIEPEKDYSEMMQEVSKDYDATSTSETIGSTDINSEKTQTPFDDFYEESDDERQNFDETEPTPEEIAASSVTRLCRRYLYRSYSRYHCRQFCRWFCVWQDPPLARTPANDQQVRYSRHCNGFPVGCGKNRPS